MTAKKNILFFLFFSISIVVVLSFLSNSSFAQENNKISKKNHAVDSLLLLLNTSGEDEAKVLNLNALSQELYKDPTSCSIQYAEEALQLSQKLSFNDGILKSLISLGLAYKFKNNFEKSIEFYLQALKIQYEKNNKSEIITTLTEIADLYNSQKNYLKSIEYYSSAINLIKELLIKSESSNNIAAKNILIFQDATLHYSIGQVYQIQNKYDISIKHFAKALKLFEIVKDENKIADVSVSMGIVLYSRSNKVKTQTFLFKDGSQDAAEYLLNGVKIYRKNNNKNGIIKANNHLAYIYSGQEKFDSALEVAFEGLKLADEINNREMIVFLNGTIGDVYFSQGNNAKALEFLNKCLEGALAFNNKVYLRDLYLNISSVYSKCGDYKKAYKLHTLYSAISDILKKEQMGVHLMEINAKYDFEKKVNEANKRDAELLKEQEDLRMRKLNTINYIIYAAALAVILFFIFIIYRNNKKVIIRFKLQKLEIEKSYQNIAILSEIEQEVTASLSVEKIIEKVYENINKLMVADVFCIGIPNKTKNTIDFPSFIEHGQKYSSSYDLNDDTRLPVLCFKNGQEIFINDLKMEFQEYIPFIPTPLVGDLPQSLIYLPLIIKGKIIGVINVESFTKHSYTKRHLEILRNLAVYIAIALENAQLYENMEEKIKERTKDVSTQKEEVEKSYENTKLLSNIGREITSVLSVEQITKKVYENVNKLMDASVFGVGIFNEIENNIEFKGVIEKGVELPNHFEELSEEGRPTIFCFKQQKELFSNNYRKDFDIYFPGKIYPIPTKGESVGSVIYLPLSTKNKKIGVITVQSFKENAYSEYHLDMLRNLAVYLVSALENAHLYKNMEELVENRTKEVISQKEELESSRNNISVLSEIGKELTSSLDFEGIFSKLHKNINRLMDAGTFGVRIFHADTNTVEIKYEFDKGIRIAPFSFSTINSDNYSVWCINNKKEIFINDNLTEYKNYVNNIVVITGEMTHSLMFCPMILKDLVIGVITVQSYEKNSYTMHHLSMLRTLANYTAIAYENAQLYVDLEKKIADRTVEVLKQKEEVVKHYENTKLLSNIGREIASVLSVEEICNKVYENVNKLMDASVFGIGVFNKSKNSLDFIGVIEKGEKLPNHSVPLSDENRPAILCFTKQQEIIISDFHKEYSLYFQNSNVPEPAEGMQSNSLIYFPLATKQIFIGVITVQSFNKNAYSEYQLDILRNLAVYIVNALENANLYENMEEEVKTRTQELVKQKEELEKSYKNISVLSQIGREISSSLSIENIIEKVYQNVNKLMDASVFTIGIYNEELKRLDFIGTIEYGEKISNQSVDTTVSNRLASICFNDQKVVFINDYETEYKIYFKEYPQPIAGLASHSIMYIPLIAKGKAIGVITVQSVHKNAFSTYHLNILQSTAIYAAIAIENAQLYESLEGKVVKRTEELFKQKEELEKTYQNTKLLSDIGMEISSVLSVEEIIKKAYEKVNKLMDASAFGIGIYDDQEKCLNFPGFIEKGEKLPYFFIDLKDEFRPAVWCFKKQQQIFINDLKKEYNNYFPGMDIPVPKEGEQSESIIYLPISTPNKFIGVITVQSFKQNAYSDYQLNILKNLAIFIVNGIENARLYENMEDEVKLRTIEIENQKNELARLSIVASETDNGVLIFAANGDIEWVNTAYTRLQGFSLEELKQSGNTLEKNNNNPEIKNLISDCIKFKKSSIYQSLNITKDEKKIWLQSSLTPIFDENGGLKNWVIIDTDVTARKIAEDGIRLQNEKITDSINYAKSIQEAILLPIEEIKIHLPEAFILYKPKDIVSGDFYWIYEENGKVFIAVADCTGHGVPGAFMSLLGNNFLNDIVKVQGKSVPSEILDELNVQVLNSLNQKSNNTSVKYGMDIALLCFDAPNKKVSNGNGINKVKPNIENKQFKVRDSSAPHSAADGVGTLQFAGAHSPLLIYRDGICIPIKGDQRSIGSFQKNEAEGFTNHSFQLMKGDMLFIFSDGYADQIGGKEHKKIFAQPFRELLKSISPLEVSEQKKTLDTFITEWRGNLNQTDDILVLGFRV